MRRYDTMRIRYGYDTDAMPHDTLYDLRYGYGATRYDTLVRDNDGSLPPDRVREPIKFYVPDQAHAVSKGSST